MTLSGVITLISRFFTTYSYTPDNVLNILMRRFFSVILCEQVIFFFIKKGPVFWLLGNNRSHSGPNFMTGPSFVSRLRAIVCYID